MANAMSVRGNPRIAGRPKSGPAVPILLYHDVAETASDAFSVSPRSFARHMQLVADSGRTPLTVDAYAAALRGAAVMPSHPVLVTFDDGYPQFPAAVATMDEIGVRAATVYVTAGYLGQPGQLSWKELRDLPQWVQVGAHTRTHPQLDLLSPGEAENEIRGSRDDVQDHLGSACESFAYPHGHFHAGVRGQVVAAGFSSAAAVRNALSHAAEDVYALSRVTVMRATTDEQLDALLAGEGAQLGWRRERMRTKAFRRYRRFRRRLGV